jgi:regulator of sirC expression with transglutaminase-like and TPR domain
MNLSFDVPNPLDYFATLVANDADFALFESAVSLAHDEYPDLDVQAVLDEVDQLQLRLRQRVPSDAGALQKLKTLNQFFFQELGFGCNVNNYYEPDNSFINVVLRTRRGIPISLAVLWMELAQDLGLSVRGLAFPGHFLVRVTLPMGQAVIDPVDGKSLSKEALSERMDGFDSPAGLYLPTASPREIVARMLHNLKHIYGTNGDLQRLASVDARLAVLLPTTHSVA